ncbi:MAG TPA: (2Fe-2S)-binding protein [Gaiellales bacterium]|jgi:aerobic-type carbon monoxide dehydrogenase small subunit (CoxS/CutS family)|nr:(2Fe-2S)-binding protein [Gaiellales bacterium]
MHLVVNGLEHEIRADGLTSLLRVLREELLVLSPKAGCEQGGCGACTVLIDGQPRRACLTPVAAIEGAEVTTVEGLSDGVDLAPIQQAFYDKYASQCGFCSPGMMMAATALLAHTPQASREQIMEALEGHLCRCTGYVKILDAVESVAKAGSV